MNFNEEMSGGRITMPLAKKDITTDISEDTVLADYYPEIRKVLCVKENLLPPAKFVSGNKIDVNGVIDYTLVYVSGDGRLCSAPLSAEYSFSLPLENIGDFEVSEGLSIIAHSTCESSGVRVNSPRRLQVRSRIRTAISVFGKMICAEKLVGNEDKECVEYLKRTGNNAEIICESSDVVSIEDEYVLPSADCRIAAADGKVQINGSRIDGDTLRIQGDVIIKMLLLCNEGEDVKVDKAVRKLPFEADTDLDGIDISDKTLCSVNGFITDITINSDGTDGKVGISASLILEACSTNNVPVRYTEDVYSTRRSCQSEYKTLKLPVVLCNKNGNLTQSERVPLNQAGVAEGAEIVDVSACAYIDSAATEEGNQVLRGNCKYILICKKDGEYSSAEVKIPFRFEVDGSEGELEAESFDGLADVISCRARSDGEFLNLDGEIAVSCILWGSKEAKMLDRAEFGEVNQPKKGGFTVCYPTPDDTVWSIAKRYSVLQRDVSGDPLTDSFVMIEF